MGKVWELDFYSRPIVDDRGKKRWEVLIREAPLTVTADPANLYEYSQFFSNVEVNSVSLKTALEAALAESGQAPTQVRFFRRQMTNMITKACNELGLNPKPSRRTIALQDLLQTRLAAVYPTMAGYQNAVPPIAGYTPLPPAPLPDALQSQQWAFVSLSAADLQDMPEWDIDFGDGFPLSLANLNPETRVPGLLLFSPRATAIAAWMSGLELAYLYVTPGDRPQLILETGASDGWILADLTKADWQAEAAGFTTAKAGANGVHFIAVQSDPEAETFAGFWLLRELNLG